MSTPNRADGPRPEATTRAGRVRGMWRHDVAVFLGIPFAQPPVGPLRFAAPVPPEPWGGVRDAVEYGPTTDRVPIPGHIMPETVVLGDETLNLNVFTPALAHEPPSGLPVMVWIHGGGFYGGSPKNEWYEGESFTRDGVVVVTVDYRLGVDGFGCIDGAPHNRGVLDWLAALEWVSDNIAAFGGDPARVTIAGQSAGGGAVLTLLGMQRAQPLFCAAISLSGAVADVPRARADEFTRRLAARAGVAGDRAGLASLSEARLLELQSQQFAGFATPARERLAMTRAMLDGAFPTGPMIDGDLLERPTVDSLALGVGADKPLLIATVDDELTSETARGMPRVVDLLPRFPALRMLGIPGSVARAYLARHRGLKPRRLLGQLLTDALFRRLALDVATARGTAATWLARVGWTSPAFGDALHCLDLPFFFDVLGSPTVYRLVGPQAPQQIADDLHGAAVRLIRGHEPQWEAWTPERGATRVLNTTIVTELDGYADVRPLSLDPPMSLGVERAS
ncbi:carboxylesterase/lipase family protein [Microbacterium sp. 18062]|uniref:carboxylesterase/lipase family protein n=1 Tax=Microbacterium sp. 18062 TaxID=2681410 RepID=UPI0013595158|nr:carboxylesterase family protein [Microbacterium sp. 18062]